MTKYYPLLIFISLFICPSSSQANSIDYPVSNKSGVVDNYHGYLIKDPYRDLENLDSADTKLWIKNQNIFSQSFLKQIKQPQEFKQILENVYDKESQSIPFRKKTRYFSYYNNGSWQQSKLFYSNNVNSIKTLLLDPNILSKDGTVSIGSVSISPNAELIAYSISDGGSDWKTWKIRNIDTKKDLPETIQWSKFSGAEWAKDNSGFYYSRYSEPKPGDEYEELNRNQKLFFHSIGESQSNDKLIYERPDKPEWGWGTTATEDGHYLLLSVSEGTDERNRIFYQDLKTENNSFIELISELIGQFIFLGNIGSDFLFFTDFKAPKGKIISIDINNPQPTNWKTLVAETNDTLTRVELLDNYILCQYLQDVSSEILLVDKKTFSKKKISFDKKGIISGITATQDSDVFYFSFTNYIQPNEIYQYNARNDRINLLWKKQVPNYKPENYLSKQIFYPSKDGTLIPMHISYKKDINLDHNTPLLLYGYGGFDISILPSFRERYLAWMKMGGVVAVPNLRGGGEYGEEWHRQGMLENKQNVFDDFIAAAEYLHREKISRPGRTAIEGRSNGGLLVGATMLQRPDLFGVALPGVGVMDMLRFNKFTIGWAWESDYGSPKDKQGFETLVQYSPYHNIKMGECYPPTLVTTAELDDRVVPSHSYKFTARLQEAQNCQNPVLIRIEARAGHGAGTPKDKTINYISDVYGFAFHYLLQN